MLSMMSMDEGKDILTMKDLLKEFGVDLENTNQFQHNGEMCKIKFYWKDGLFMGDLNQAAPVPQPKEIKIEGLDPGKPSRDSTFKLQVDHLSIGSNKHLGVGLMRPQTFLEKKDQLIQNDNYKKVSEEYQHDLRERANAFIDSIKAKKVKEQRIHLAFLFASPLVIKFQEESQTPSERNSQALMKIDFEREFLEISKVLKDCRTCINYYKS